MNVHADKTQENKTKPAAENSTKLKSDNASASQFVDNRPEAIAQRKLQEAIGNKSIVQRKVKAPKESSQENVEPIQKKENNTGLPDNLKSGIENLSGHSLDDVKVHYNSDKPAQLQAHAYAQGTDIHLATGQEKHLPHEAWHVVQQKQGRVKPTIQLKGNVKVNDDAGLEKEADVMGNQAMFHQVTKVSLATSKISDNTIQREIITTHVKGKTHLVQAVHGSIFNGIQGRLLMNGTAIVVDTSDKIRSRRGPNQEIFRHYDVQNAPEYRWVRVIKVGLETQPPSTYIRDDTFIGGADIPRGSAFAPAIDHRGRKQPAIPARTFAPLHAPEWYERRLGHAKSSTADRKHAKLLAVAFDSSVEGIGPKMVASARDPDTLTALETVGQHVTHVTPWIPEDVENHGKDRHHGLKKSGEYFRTSPAHPLHQEYEMHQRASNLHRDATAEPINPGWADIASHVMGVRNMRDIPIDGPRGIKVRKAEDPERFARGPGAVIGNEEMAREIARMRYNILLTQARHDQLGEIEEVIAKTRAEHRHAQDSVVRLEQELATLRDRISKYSALRGALGKKIGVATAATSKAKATSSDEDASEDAAAATSTAQAEHLAKAKAEADDAAAAMDKVQALRAEMEQISKDEARDKQAQKQCTADLQIARKKESELTGVIQQLLERHAYHMQFKSSPTSTSASGLGAALQKPRTTNLRPLTAVRPSEHQYRMDNFASRLHHNRRQVKLHHLFGDSHIGPITDRSGIEHPNLILHKEEWGGKEDAGVREMHEGWKASTLKTDLQVRGSFGHHRPSISPLVNGMVRINPGLYPMSLLQFGLTYALRAESVPKIDTRMDFIHREALHVAVDHALSVIAADRPGRSDKIQRIKEFAKHNLMINLLKAQTILKAHGPNPKEYGPYIVWLEKDFIKTTQALENLNESTHLLLSARVNEESSQRRDEPLMLRPGPFRQFIHHTFARSGKEVRIYYVASGMQAISTGAIAAVYYRRMKSKAELGKPAGYIPLHPYFEMKGATAAAAGFKSGLDPETIIADLSPLDTTITPEQQSHLAIATGLLGAVKDDPTLVPVLDATTIPLDEAAAMVPKEATNFIIVESLTKYAQLGSDKAIGGRIIVVGSKEFADATAEVIGPVQQSADMIVSKIWFESMENMRYSH